MCFKKKTMLDIVKECEKKNQILRDKTVCFTGHRCQKLPWGYNESDERCIKMRETAKEKIEFAILNGYKYFISGMALGFDMISAELVLEFKKKISIYKINMCVTM